MTSEEERPPEDGKTARLVSGFGFLYAVVVTVLLLPLEDFFRDDPNRDAVLLWLLLPVVASFGTWMAVRSGFAPLRAWVWFGIVATMFFCWIAVFSFGLLFLPLPVLMMVAAISPWDRPVDAESRRLTVAEERERRQAPAGPAQPEEPC